MAKKRNFSIKNIILNFLKSQIDHFTVPNRSFYIPKSIILQFQIMKPIDPNRLFYRPKNIVPNRHFYSPKSILY